MKFTGFEPADFELFEVDGLDERMSLLISQLRPKFNVMGEELAPHLTDLTGESMYSHTAMHARRKVNPPDDSWVAFAANARGYKMLPHFQVGLWATHVFIQWGIIYECKNKPHFGRQLIIHRDEVRKNIPGRFLWFRDHMNPDGVPLQNMNDAEYDQLAGRLEKYKSGELMVGLNIDKETAVRMSSQQVYDTILSTWETLLFLHNLSRF